MANVRPLDVERRSAALCHTELEHRVGRATETPNTVLHPLQ